MEFFSPDAAPKSKAPSQRQLRVGEEIRHALSDILRRGEVRAVEMLGISITVSEVRISPDLKNATAYVSSLTGAKQKEMIEALTRTAPEIRHQIGKKIIVRHVPRLSFKIDTSFDEANRINQLLHSPEVARDLSKPRDEDGATSE